MSEIDELKADVAALRKEVLKLSRELEALKKMHHFSLADLKKVLPGMLQEHQKR